MAFSGTVEESFGTINISIQSRAFARGLRSITYAGVMHLDINYARIHFLLGWLLTNHV